MNGVARAHFSSRQHGGVNSGARVVLLTGDLRIAESVRFRRNRLPPLFHLHRLYVLYQVVDTQLNLGLGVL